MVPDSASEGRPVRISGPVSRPMTRSAELSSPVEEAQVSSIVLAPKPPACSRAPRTQGVTELAEIPTSRSPGRRPAAA